MFSIKILNHFKYSFKESSNSKWSFTLLYKQQATKDKKMSKINMDILFRAYSMETLHSSLYLDIILYVDSGGVMNSGPRYICVATALLKC